MDPLDRRTRANVNTLYAGAEAEHYTLPDSMHQALRAEERVRDLLAEARGEVERVASIGDVTAALATAVVDAARSGATIPDFAAQVAEAEEAERQARLRVTVLELSVDEAGRTVIYGTSAETIIADHLRPALDETLDAARKAASKLADYDVTDPSAILRAPEPVRRAFTSLQDATRRYEAIRTAQRAVSAMLGGTNDKGAYFAELRDPKAHGVALGGPAARPQPWPADPMGRLLWLASLPERSVWLPTPAEQDAAAEQYLAELQRKRGGRSGVVALGW